MSQKVSGHDLNVDWWSVGVLTIELLTGQSPFSREGEESNQQVISNRIQKEAPNIPASVRFLLLFYVCDVINILTIFRSVLTHETSLRDCSRKTRERDWDSVMTPKTSRDTNSSRKSTGRK